MSGPDRGSAASNPTDGLLASLRERALTALAHARARPPLELQEEVDTAERAVARLRDGLIERLRRDNAVAQAATWREALKQVNAVLSLIVGLEYPVAREQRRLLDQAHDSLSKVRL